MSRIKRFMKALGYPNLNNLFSLPGYFSEYRKLKRLSADSGERFELSAKNFYPLLEDKRKIHEIDSHYIYHPAWAARILAKTKPIKHIDVSSLLNFSTIASAFLEIEFYDYRPAQLNLNNFSSHSGDLNKLPFPSASIQSLSCMHVVEHIGLGRYGDVLDYDGDLKAIKELIRVMSIGGNLLFVTPIGGINKIEFNAHRIYRYDQIINLFPLFLLIDFSFVTDDGKFIENCDKELTLSQNYGCGCFWLQKIKE